MKTILLAAGYATRLYPLTENFPKPLLDVGGKPILDWLIGDLAASGRMDEFIVVSNHRFFPQFSEWARRSAFPITVLDDGTDSNETRLGAVRDIWFAAERLDAGADVLVLAGDNVLDFSLNPFVTFAAESGCSCVMYYEEPDPARQRRTAIITLGADGVITSYEEKPAAPKSTLAVPPFYFYRAEDLRRIPEALAAGCGYDAPGSFAAWLSRQTAVRAYRMPGSRYDIGDMQSYQAIRDSYRGIGIRKEEPNHAEN